VPARADAPGRLGLLAALLGLHLILVMPAGAGAWSLAGPAMLPLELAIVLAAMALAPAGRRRPVGRLVLALIALVLLLKLADLAARTTLGRTFNPVFDLHLVAAGWALVTGAVGTAVAVGWAVATAAAYALVIVATGRALAVVAAWLDARVSGGRERGMVVGLALLVAGAAALLGSSAPNAALLADRWRAGVDAAASLRTLAQDAAADAQADVASGELLDGLRGRDVLFLVVESYGRSALEDARYAPSIRARLEGFEDTLAAAGYGARSGWLTAPVKGGQSWLAHATLLTGLRIDHQQRYASLLASERRSLIHGFARAGWRTVAVMPAITMPWPEGAWFGYDATYTADDLGYAGAPFNWVTMPDQYTLSALERLELARPDRPPVMAEVALISSHAPWTPIPPVLDWEAVGDGSVFTPYARAGDPPAVVWRDVERVRAQYLKAVDYALANLASYVATFGRDDLVLVVVGDHQPAPLVTGEGAGFDVPMHIIAAPEVLGEIDGWGWSTGLTPGEDLPAWPMAAFRDRFVDAFSGAASPPASPVQASTTDTGA